MSSIVAANMRKTTEGLLYSWNGDWINSLKPNLAVRAPECRQVMLPATVGGHEMSNDDFAKYFKRIEHLITDAKMTIQDYLAVPDDRRAVCRSSIEATSPVGPFRNEYVWFLSFNDTGDKIVRIEEFLDSKATEEFRSQMRARGHIK